MACIKVRVFVVLRLPLSISTHETAPSSSYAARRGRPIRGGGRQTAPSDGLIGRYILPSAAYAARALRACLASAPPLAWFDSDNIVCLLCDNR
jgi:hypothetical protein